MDYNFDEIIDRRPFGSLKWDVSEGELPLWVADMDFATAPEVQEALQRRLSHGVFGYSVVPETWQGAYMHWWESRHGFVMQPDWLVFCTGVVPAISSIVRKLTTPGENVVVLTPVYNIFFNSIVNNGRTAVQCPLAYNGQEYAIDFDALEAVLADPQTTMLLLCNPHNPTGTLWSAEVLARVGDLCAHTNVVVVSDEIHCDVVAPGTTYVPFASISDACKDNSITCLSPSKAFNLAGLQSAAVCVPNEALRHKVWRALNTDEVAEPNAFAVDATCATFEEGEPWLDALRVYLWDNRRFAEEFLQERGLPVHAVAAEATYLLWLDAREVGESSDALVARIRKQTGLVLCSGADYGQAGEGFLRLNLACPRFVLEDALQRLEAAFDRTG